MCIQGEVWWGGVCTRFERRNLLHSFIGRSEFVKTEVTSYQKLNELKILHMWVRITLKGIKDANLKQVVNKTDHTYPQAFSLMDVVY